MMASEPGGGAALLAVLDALLDLAGDAEAAARLLRRARDFFAGDDGLLLLPNDEALRCVAADPGADVGAQWPASAELLTAARSRVLAVGGASGRMLLPRDLVADGAPALLLPIAYAG